VENWRCFVKKVENEGVFCKKVENVWCFFVKSGPFLNTECIMYSISIFLFYILLIWGGGAHTTHPPCLRACRMLGRTPSYLSDLGRPVSTVVSKSELGCVLQLRKTSSLAPQSRDLRQLTFFLRSLLRGPELCEIFGQWTLSSRPLINVSV